MFKIMSSEEHARLTGDRDYWNVQTLEEERQKNFYHTLAVELERENVALKRKIKELEEFDSFEDFDSFKWIDWDCLIKVIARDCKNNDSVIVFNTWNNKLRLKGFRLYKAIEYSSVVGYYNRYTIFNKENKTVITFHEWD